MTPAEIARKLRHELPAEYGLFEDHIETIVERVIELRDAAPVPEDVREVLRLLDIEICAHKMSDDTLGNRYEAVSKASKLIAALAREGVPDGWSILIAASECGTTPLLPCYEPTPFNERIWMLAHARGVQMAVEAGKKALLAAAPTPGEGDG